MRLIDADELKKRLHLIATGQYDEEEKGSILSNMPTVDAVPVVRCKDCKWFRVEDWGEMWCAHTNGMTICLESYCYDGQRRDEHAAD